MARSLITVAVMALLLALPASAHAASPLAGTKWSVKRVGGHAVPARERLNFGTRSFGGHDDCNSIGGHNRAGASRLRFSDILSTAIGCEYAPGTAPPSFTRALLRTRFYRLTGGQLLLLGKRGRTLATLAPRGS